MERGHELIYIPAAASPYSEIPHDQLLPERRDHAQSYLPSVAAVDERGRLVREAVFLFSYVPPMQKSST